MRTIGFIGAGNMAETIIAGLKEREGTAKESFSLTFYNRNEERRQYMSDTYGITAASNNAALYEQADVVVLAVKPQQFSQVVETLRQFDVLKKKPLIISIMAGVPLAYLADVLENDRLIRVMPNVAAQVKASMSAIACSDATTDEDAALAEAVFASIGGTFLVSEAQLDAASAVNGCGPAFFFQIIEACADALVDLGIPRAMAYEISAQTMAGSAALVLKSNEHPAVLKDKVTSPGGTTIAGTIAMEQYGVRAGIMAAIEASYEKNKALSERK